MKTPGSLITGYHKTIIPQHCTLPKKAQIIQEITMRNIQIICDPRVSRNRQLSQQSSALSFETAQLSESYLNGDDGMSRLNWLCPFFASRPPPAPENLT